MATTLAFTDADTSTYGTAIPTVIGSAWVTPKIVWASTSVPTISNPTNTTFYSGGNPWSITAASSGGLGCWLLICRGPVTIQAVKINGVVYGQGGASGNTLAAGYWKLAGKQTLQAKAWNINGVTGYSWSGFAINRFGFRVLTGATASPWGQAYTCSSTYSSTGGVVQADTSTGLTTFSTAVADITGATQPAWQRWADMYGASAPAGLTYPGLCGIQFESIAQDSAGKIPAIQFLVQSLTASSSGTVPVSTAIKMVCSAAGITDVVTNLGADNTYASSQEAYEAAGLVQQVAGSVSLGTDSVGDVLQALAAAGNCQIVRRGGTLRVLPLGDTASGVFTPPSTAVEIDATDLLDDDGIKVTFRDESERVNRLTVKYKPVGATDDLTETVQDSADITSHSQKTGDDLSNDWVVTQAGARQLGLQTIARSIHERIKYEATVSGARFQALEAGDLLWLSDGRAISGALARLDEAKLTDSGRLELTAWNWTQGSATPVDLTPQAYEGGVVVSEAYDAATNLASVAAQVAQAQSDATAAASTASAASTAASAASTAASSAASAASTAQSTATSAASAASTAQNTANTAASNASTALSTANTASSNASTALSTANTALTTANGKNDVSLSATPPSTPTAGDIWFNSDLTTACTLSSCSGHTLDSTGVPQVGSYPHRVTGWCHVYSGTVWTDQGKNSITVSEINAASLSAISANLGTITAGVILYQNNGYVSIAGNGFGPSSNYLRWWGPVPSGASTTAAILAGLTDASAKYYEKTDGTSVARFDSMTLAGSVSANYISTLLGIVAGQSVTATNSLISTYGVVTASDSTASTMTVRGTITTSSTAIGVILTNSNSLTTAGSKLVSIQNAGTEKAYVDNYGRFVSPDNAVLAYSWAGNTSYTPDCSVASRWVLTLAGGSGTYTLNAPINARAGQVIILHLKQGSAALPVAFNSVFRPAYSATPTASKGILLMYYYSSDGYWYQIGTTTTGLTN